MIILIILITFVLIYFSYSIINILLNYYNNNEYNGEALQDKFVINIKKKKKNGLFVEIGSSHPKEKNNTYILEKKYDWKGLMIEMDSNYLPLYKKYRTNSIHIINDATKIDYLELFKKYKLNKHIDYLQIDLEVENESTIKTLELFDKNIFDKYKFATITFEHDIYQTRKKNNNEIFSYTRQKSRQILKKHGYICIFKDVHKGNPRRIFEDWYVHPDLVDNNYISYILNINKTYLKTNKGINAYNIKY